MQGAVNGTQMGDAQQFSDREMVMSVVKVKNIKAIELRDHMVELDHVVNSWIAAGSTQA